MRIAVIGTGYVGLVTGTCLADAGHEATCIDIDSAKVERMSQGDIPIYESGLEVIFQKSIETNSLHFTTDLKTSVNGAAAIFLALPTPPGEDGSADLSYILGVADQLGELLTDYAVVVNKSTVPVGTAEMVKERIAKKAKVSFDVVSNPEFLREGHAVNDFQSPDRIVVGATSEQARAVMSEVYHGFTDVDNPIIFMDERSAEMTKYAANAFLATKITFMNQIANLAEAVGANVDKIRIGIGSDERIGRQFLHAGIGYGGSCFPKDVLALEATAQEYKSDFSLLTAVSAANMQQKQILPAKVLAYFSNDINGKKFALWGLAFKPDTDDIREAPSLTIIDVLLQHGATIVAHDPEAAVNVGRLYADKQSLTFVDDRYQALDGADALLVVTEWQEFRSADPSVMKARLKQPVIFDGRNIYDLEPMMEAGFYYESIGRPVVNKGGMNE